MTSRNIAIIAVVVVIAVAACAALMLSGDGGNDSSDDNTIDYLTPDSGKAKVSSVDTKLLVFGNANNDVYLDEKDVQFIQDIVDGKTKWDKEKNPFADTNADGKITAEDVVLLKRFIDRQDATMFYVNSNLDTVSVKWPLAGNIMIGGVNDADILKIIGKVDSVVAVCGTHDPKDFDKTVYPEAVNWKYAGSYPYDYETVVSMEGSILMGQNFMYTEEFDKKVSDGYDKIRIDSVKLHEARFMNNVDGVACTITLGALMNCFDYPTYKQYLDYVANVESIIEKATSSIPAGKELTYALLTSHSCTSPTSLGIDNKSLSGIDYGDIGTVSYLKLTNAIPAAEKGYVTGLSVENILKYDPDIIIIEAVGFYNKDKTYAEYQAKVNEIAGWFAAAGDYCSAYKNNMIFGAVFDVFGNAPNISIIPLMVSLIYGEDVYPSEDAWENLAYYYNTFLGNNYTIEELKKSIIAPFKVTF